MEVSQIFRTTSRSAFTPDLDSIRFSCHGVRVSVAFDTRIPAAQIRSILPPQFVECTEAEHHFSLVRMNGTQDLYIVRGGVTRTASHWYLADSISALRRKIQLCIAEHARNRVFIHAGVVGWDGQAIVCPGRSHAGKSTLIRSLLCSGATYYSDEYAVIDTEGRIDPFPLPIHIRSGAPSGVKISPHQTGVDSLKAGLILFTQFRENRTWKPTPLTPGQAMLRLLRNSISMRRNPALVLRVLKSITLAAEAYAGERGEALEVVEWLKTFRV